MPEPESVRFFHTPALLGTVVVFLVVVAFACLVQPLTAQSNDTEKLRAQLEKQEQQLAGAEKSQSKSSLEDLLSRDLIFVAYNGLVFDQQNLLQKIGYLNLSQYKMENVKLREVGPSAALITYDLLVNANVVGQKLPHKQYASSLWIKQGSRWQLLFHQATPAAH